MDSTVDLPSSRTGVERNWKACLCALVAGLVLVPSSVAAQTNTATAYEVKAAFLYNFAKFFEWPAAARDRDNQPFTLCVLGQTEVTSQLQSLLGGKSVDTHPVHVRLVHATEEARSCQILFIAAVAAPQATRYLKELADISVLTVGEVPGFCSLGGIVNFWREADHIRFEINPPAAERAHLHASSKLLRLARIVGEADGNEGGHLK